MIQMSSGDRSTSVSSQCLQVLMVTPRYFPNVGGVENHVYQVARRLAQKGMSVTVLTTDPSRQLPRSEQSDGVKIQRVRTWPADRDYYFAPDIYEIVTHGDWDIVHVQSYHTFVAPLAMLAAWRIKTPFVVTFHGGGHSSRWRNALRPLQRILLRPMLVRAQRLVALADFEIEGFGRELRIPRERFVLIPNGSELPHVPTATLRATQDSTWIASVGRLEKYKGHHRILAALPSIVKQQPDARLWIAGEGPFRSDLERLVQKLGMTEHVEIRAIPAADRETMASELGRAALVVLLSEYETHPISILEALALGRPVLVADTAGLRELAARGWARTIPLQSTSDEIAMAVIELLRHPPASQPIRLPSWDDCAASLIELYYSVVGSVRCAS